ncbi:MAG: alpha/beta hydrolase [Propionicimonas sp.]|nr:alpha/beta hydrolase [Propionicimonas sp.]
MRLFTENLSPTGQLTCYLQDRSDELSNARVRPAVLVLPGGGYSFCSDREAEPVALAYLAEGFNAFVLRYAAGPDAPWTQSFADGQAGLAWIRQHAGELDVDPARIAAVGFSAGGHLAASLGVAGDDRPDALVLGYPVTLAEFGPPIGKEILDVVDAVNDQTPPTFLFSTYPDSLVPIRNSLELLSALAAHDVPCESHIYLLGAHGLSLAKPLTANGGSWGVDPVVAQWLPDSVRFLQRVLRDFPVEGAPSTFADLEQRKRFGLGMQVRRLLADERAVAIIDDHLPGVTRLLRQDQLVEGFPLREALGFSPQPIDPEVLARLGERLAALND